MPTIRWRFVLAKPWASLQVVLLGSFLTAKSIVSRILLPLADRKTSFQVALARAWLGAAFRYNLAVLYSEPPGHGVQNVRSSTFSSYAVPNADRAALEEADVIVVFAHGGGMFLGHALQYLDTFERWVRKAKAIGQNLIVMSVDYRESMLPPAPKLFLDGRS